MDYHLPQEKVLNESHEALRSPHSPFIDINGEWCQFRLNFSQRHCDSLKNRYGIPVIKTWHRTPTISPPGMMFQNRATGAA